ncbi:aminotransferase class V-fold PLP-dependent enzyme [Halomonas denitrificans]|nr:aminotransferase class V-fold PLP-dependent enzyme [Halomonas denitrificans]
MIDPNDFPVLEREVWLNHAAISPWPAAVIRAMRAFVDDNAAHGPMHYDRWLATERRLRERAARLLEAESADDVALVKNTSEGLSLIAAGLDWRPGDRMLFLAGEFPSNRLPWVQLLPDHVDVVEVPFASSDPEAALLDALDERTRLVAVSSVRYDSGIRLDLDRLGRACRRAGALLAVDAIQQLGALPLAVRDLPVDFVVAGSHKWLLAPEGLALFWSAPDARDRLRPVQTGWRMWPDMFDFDRDDTSIPRHARRFEPGTLNTAGIHGLDAALGLLLSTPAAERGARLLAATRRLIDGLAALPGIDVLTPGDDRRRAGIVTFRCTGRDPRRVLAALRAGSVVAAPRSGGLRLSPHWYTPTDQIDRALDVIESALR